MSNVINVYLLFSQKYFNLRNKKPYYLEKLILSLYLFIGNYKVFATCDVETDPFCAGDVDANLDEHLFFLLFCGLVFACITIVKKHKPAIENQSGTFMNR